MELCRFSWRCLVRLVFRARSNLVGFDGFRGWTIFLYFAVGSAASYI